MGTKKEVSYGAEANYFIDTYCIHRLEDLLFKLRLSINKEILRNRKRKCFDKLYYLQESRGQGKRKHGL